MAKKIAELLKEKGFTEDEQKLILENKKLLETFQGELDNLEYLAEVGKKDAAEALRWREEEALPTLQKHMDEARVARGEAAALKEQIKVLQEQGLIKMEEIDAAKKNPPVASPAPFDPKEHKLVTLDDVARFADAEGAAIAMANDLALEYQSLYGKSIIDYVGKDGKRGMTALREEAKANKSPDLYAFVSQKFKFDEKRAEITRKAQEDHDKEVEARGYAKRIAEETNPNLRTPQASRMPFTQVKDKSGAMPWENAEERRSGRVERVAQKALLGA